MTTHPQALIASRRAAHEAGQKRYFTGIPCLSGHLSERHVSTGHCLECDRLRSAQKRASDPEKFRADMRVRYAANPSKWKRLELERRLADPTSFKLQRRSNYAKNAEKIGAARRARRAIDKIWSFNDRARTLIRGALVASGFKKNSRTEQILGCTMAEFRAHIERQFLPGMGWHNMHLWEIDHIVPASSAQNQQDAEALNRASNLRPLWRDDNRRKSAKLTHLI